VSIGRPLAPWTLPSLPRCHYRQAAHLRPDGLRECNAGGPRPPGPQQPSPQRIMYLHMVLPARRNSVGGQR